MKIAALVLLLLTGCVSSRQARSVETDEFLGTSTALLRPGVRGEEPLLVYRKPDTNWASYNTIVLDPIVMRSSIELADDQRLADSFHATLREKLAADYTIVDSPQPQALRLQMAILDHAGANGTLKVIKTVAPYAEYRRRALDLRHRQAGLRRRGVARIHDSRRGHRRAAGRRCRPARRRQSARQGDVHDLGRREQHPHLLVGPRGLQPLPRSRRGGLQQAECRSDLELSSCHPERESRDLGVGRHDACGMCMVPPTHPGPSTHARDDKSYAATASRSPRRCRYRSPRPHTPARSPHRDVRG